MAYSYPTAFSHWGIEEHAAIQRVIQSGKFTMGAECEAFEQEFADYHSMKYGVMTNSGSSANLLMIATLFHVHHNPLKRGDKVIVPALAWSTTYAPLVQMGLDLVLADCDETWNATRQSLLTVEDSRIIVGCSILGNPAFSYLWRDWAEYSGAYYVEDNCESLGAKFTDGVLCGTEGIMNTFSFFYSHQLSAIEGGMILTNDEECYRLLRMLRAHGWTRDVTKPATFADEYDFELFGYNLRPLEIHAAVAREQLKKLDGFIAARLNNWQIFQEMADQAGLLEWIALPPWNGSPSPFGIQFQVDTNENILLCESKRAKIVKALRANGIDCRLPTGGSFRLHKYGAPWRDQSTPNADRIHRTGLFIGNAPYDISDKIERRAVGSPPHS